MKNLPVYLAVIAIPLLAFLGTIVNYLFIFLLIYTLFYLYDEIKSYKEEQKRVTTVSQFYNFLEMKRQYLMSPEWTRKRELVLKRDNYRCKSCGSSSTLNVHHLWGYSLIPNESLNCLETLCKDCHTNFHNIHGYPKTYREYMKYNPLDKRNKHV